MSKLPTIHDIDQLVAVFDLIIDRASEFKAKMLHAKIQMTGVSTPVLKRSKKAIDRKAIVSIVAKRNARMGKRALK